MHDRLVSRRIDALHQRFLVFIVLLRCFTDEVEQSKGTNTHL